MSDYEKEEWWELYKTAVVELEHAKIAGRVHDARTAIVARVEKLATLPGLHSEEHQAITDALNSLRVLDHEEAQYQAGQSPSACNCRNIVVTLTNSLFGEEKPQDCENALISTVEACKAFSCRPGSNQWQKLALASC